MFGHTPDEHGPRIWIVGRSALARSGLRALLQEHALPVMGTSAELDAEPPADLLILLDTEPDDLPLTVPVLLIGDQWSRFPDTERAWGLLPGDATPHEVHAAVVALHAGLSVLPPSLIPHSLPASAVRMTTTIEPLTAREEEVLQLAAEGLTNRQMALQLHISEHTVKFHLSSIFSKLGVASRTEAVKVGAQRGLIVW